ncbi:hypothetical protein B9479_007796 [Cryptococcus floricola]|uniref:Uncharacterized protein n=1 Tax=Cryptococcus floricola TaxID=2591691 RepID=A0A5D3APN1_9TREE|nr:hypothetical protein B9479_007796 [Cryptococcus floricola]
MNMAEEEELGNPSSSYGGSFLLPGPSQGNDGSSWPYSAYLQGYAPDESAILDMFAYEEQSQLGHAVDSFFPSSQPYLQGYEPNWPSSAYLQGYEPDESAILGMFAGGEQPQLGYVVDSSLPSFQPYLQGYAPDESAILGTFAGGEQSQPGYAVDSFLPSFQPYLQGYAPDESDILGMFASGEQPQLGYAVDLSLPSSQPLDDTSSYHPDGVRGPRPILPRKNSTRSSGCSGTNNKSSPSVSSSQKKNATKAMISSVMSRYKSLDDLRKKKHKTWEEKRVRKLLVDRRKAGNRQKREGETMKQLESTNGELSGMLKDRDDTIEALSKFREEQTQQAAEKAERIGRLETQLSAMESLVQTTEEIVAEVYGKRYQQQPAWSSSGVTTARASEGASMPEVQVVHEGYSNTDLQYGTQMETSGEQ